MDSFKNIILNTDSYKYSMKNQYPEGTETVYSYIEARGGIFDKLVYFGLQAFLREYISKSITAEMIDEAEAIITAHGEPFYREEWEYILNEHGGYLPLRIHALDEGTVVKPGTVLVTVENTDTRCYWLTTFIETALLRAIWYPTTVCTNSFTSKKEIVKWKKKNGDENNVSFSLHDFGFRGVSSLESAAIGGVAHLVNFMGTDTVAALIAAKRWYDCDLAGFSIPASEHSTITSWGRENEIDAYRNMIKQFGKPGAIFACVSDSYDIYKACHMWGSLKDEIISSGSTLVVRPDSGNPSEVVYNCISILDKYFGHTVNEKGFKVLNTVKVIQGDGIDTQTIHSILFVLDLNGWSSDNVAFGQGGALLQAVNRDTSKFAMKCSSIFINGEDRDVYKDPITDSGKRSKRGRFDVIEKDGELITVASSYETTEISLLRLRYAYGSMYNQTNLTQVRELAAKGI